MTGQELEHKVNVSEARAQIKLIEKIWADIAKVFEGIQWGRYGSNYLAENIKEEREHDKCRPENCQRFLTITQTGKLFAVINLVNYLYSNEKLDAIDYINIRKTFFIAYSLAKNYESELKAVIPVNIVKDILNIDYAEIEQLAR